MSVDPVFARAAQLLAPPEEPAGPRHDPLGWRRLARTEQLPPLGDWDVWYVRGGRGAGKTWTCANALAEMIVENEPGEWAVVAPTMGDVRTTCFESADSGLIQALGGRVAPGGELLEHGPYISRWNRSTCELYLHNGTVIYGDGADDGALRLQGKNLRGTWADEIGLWQKWDTAWDESIGFAVRKHPAKIIASGTPKSGRPGLALVKRLLKEATDDPAGTIRTVLLRTVDNMANLAGAALTRMRLLQGTRLGRQELEGELLDDVEGAFLSRDVIDRHRVLRGDVPVLPLIVTAVDPATTAKTSSNETGIVTCGVDQAGEGYVLDDVSGRYSPDLWGRQTWKQVLLHGSQAVVVEDNAGGDMCEHVLRTTWKALDRESWARGKPLGPMPPIARVTPSGSDQSKWARAMPISVLYDQGRVHHVHDPDRDETPAHVVQPHPGVRITVHVDGDPDHAHDPDSGAPTGPRLEILEEQAVSWTGKKGETSPDRVDALVHCLTWMLFPQRRATANNTPALPESARWAGGDRR